MDFNFPAIMVSAVFITGIIWALKGLNVLKESVVVEYARSLFPVILVVLLLRSFLVEPFRIPSGSMMPTLLVGDFILVSKFSYGVRLPVINTKILDTGKPERGDVVVFRYPKNPSIDYIKRVIGLPGDKVSYYNKQLFINGEPAKQEAPETFIGIGSGVSMSGAKKRLEHLLGVDHNILIDESRGTLEGEFNVPAGHYFVMGDNRDNSNDSRYWGFVPEENLVGKAFMIWMNWDSKASGVDWDRLGNSIQ